MNPAKSQWCNVKPYDFTRFHRAQVTPLLIISIVPFCRCLVLGPNKKNSEQSLCAIVYQLKDKRKQNAKRKSIETIVESYATTNGRFFFLSYSFLLFSNHKPADR